MPAEPGVGTLGGFLVHGQSDHGVDFTRQRRPGRGYDVLSGSPAGCGVHLADGQILSSQQAAVQHIQEPLANVGRILGFVKAHSVTQTIVAVLQDVEVPKHYDRQLELATAPGFEQNLRPHAAGIADGDPDPHQLSLPPARRKAVQMSETVSGPPKPPAFVAKVRSTFPC